MTFYALTDSRLTDTELGEVVEFYASREQAEAALSDVLTNEPEWKGIVGIAEIDLGSASLN
jgi:ABC-type sugar transport system substrate-binding protein